MECSRHGREKVMRVSGVGAAESECKFPSPIEIPLSAHATPFAVGNTTQRSGLQTLCFVNNGPNNWVVIGLQLGYEIQPLHKPNRVTSWLNIDPNPAHSVTKKKEQTTQLEAGLKNRELTWKQA